MTTLYLSGPMTGIKDYNFPAFNKAATELRQAGYLVHNPAESFGGKTGLLRATSMRQDFHLLLQVDGIAVLTGWNYSAGARCEVRIAEELGLSVLEAEMWLAPGTQDMMRPRDRLDIEWLDHTRAWSEKTFGPGARTAGVLDHIRKELAEIEAEPGDVWEWADLIILAFDGACRAGIRSGQIFGAIRAKCVENEHHRTWPNWRTQDPDKAIEHIRDAS